MKTEYHEDYELRRYVWQNFRHALTAREQAVQAAAVLEFKARHASDQESAASLRHKPGYFLDAEIEAVVESGLGAFEQRCHERLLRDYADQIYINRCERCNRIVASPIACACVWCGHHWYDRRAEMVARATSSIYPKST